MIFLCRDANNDDKDDWTEVVEDDMEDAAIQFAEKRIFYDYPYEMTVAIRQPLGDEYLFELGIEYDPRICITERLGKTNGNREDKDDDSEVHD